MRKSLPPPGGTEELIGLPPMSSHWSGHGLTETIPPYGCTFPASGSIYHIDDYGIIYECTWDTIGLELNFLEVIKQPRRFDQPAGFRRVGRKTYREGLISTHQQVIQLSPDGYTILGEHFTQEVGFYLESAECGLRQTKFCVYNDTYLSDNVELRVTTGEAWCDAAEAELGAWGEPDDASAPVWIDVWGSPAATFLDELGNALLDENGFPLLLE